MSDQEYEGDVDEQGRSPRQGSGDPNDDRADLQDQPPAQVDETPKHSPVEEDEDPIAHDASEAMDGFEGSIEGA